MSDNLLLTVLGAVGIGALLVGMNQKEEVRENWGPQGMLNLSPRVERVYLNKDSQEPTALNFAQTPPNLEALKTQLSRLERAGVPDGQQLTQLSTFAVARANNQNAQFAKAVNPTVESFQNPSSHSLGSGAVTRNDYVSYPQFNQNTPLQSPSLNLPAQIRYNPPSLNNMGITSAYQSQPNNNFNGMDYAQLLEGFEGPPSRTNVNTYERNPEQNPDGTNRNIGNVANAAGYMSAFNEGTKKYSNVQDSSPVNALPLSDMDSSAGNNPSAENTMYYDRFIYANGRNGGWRASSSGSSDLIRGDLAVCVDPCQKGWFQSSLKPSDLRNGALQVIAGPSGSSANSDVAAMASAYGNVSSSGTQGQMSQLSMMQKVLQASNAGASTIAATSYA